MTIWTLRLSETGDRPIYRQIADQIEEDIETGVLLPGSRLPTQRELAARLGVTVVTVTRAYADAADRGLIESRVGRGSFVRRRSRSDQPPESVIDLATNLVEGGRVVLRKSTLDRLQQTLTIDYAAGVGTERHRAAGAAWIGRSGIDASPSRVIVTAGGQQALLIAFSALAKSGDSIFAEQVTHQGARAAAAMLGIRMEGLPLDRWGLIPDALEEAAKEKGARALYVTPTMQNPTGTVMPEKRRREIAAIAEAYDLTIIEDDVYGFLAPEATPISMHIPDRALYVTALGKSLLPSLRVGYLLAPDWLQSKLHFRLLASTLYTSPLPAEVATSLIEEGTADAVVEEKRKNVAIRQKIARRVLGDRMGACDARSPHVWVELPRWWDPEAFATAAERSGVRVTPSTGFATGEPPRAFRAALAAPPEASDLETALHVLDALIERRDVSRSEVIV